MKKRQLCKDFLLLHPPHVTYSSYTAREAMRDRWGIDIDHHEFAYAIDELVNENKMIRVKNYQSVYPFFKVMRSE